MRPMPLAAPCPCPGPLLALLARCRDLAGREPLLPGGVIPLPYPSAPLGYKPSSCAPPPWSCLEDPGTDSSRVGTVGCHAYGPVDINMVVTTKNQPGLLCSILAGSTKKGNARKRTERRLLNILAPFASVTWQVLACSASPLGRHCLHTQPQAVLHRFIDASSVTFTGGRCPPVTRGLLNVSRHGVLVQLMPLHCHALE